MRTFSLILLSWLLILPLPSAQAAVGDINTFAGASHITFAGDNGPAPAAQLNGPAGVAVDSIGNIYFADTNNRRIRMVNIKGDIHTIAGTGALGTPINDQAAINAAFTMPTGIAIDSFDNIFVSDTGSDRVYMLTPSDGVLRVLAIAGTQGELNEPRGIAFDSANNLYIADSLNHRVLKVTRAGIISIYAGTGDPGFDASANLATSSPLNNPFNVAFDADNNLYISDSLNHRIRKVDMDNNIETVIGSGINAPLNYPTSTRIDTAGNIFITDNNRIRRIDVDSKELTTIAGDGTLGFSGDVSHLATSAQLAFPYDMVLHNGNLLITDSANIRIRKIDLLNNQISTFAGTTRITYSGDGGAAADALLHNPASVAFDSEGNRYIADSSNHRIRKVSSIDGTISTFAGTGIAGFSGDGGQAINAQFTSPVGLAFDSSYNLLIADFNNHRIRKIDGLTGNISTIAGLAIDDNAAGFSGDNGAATNAQLNFPQGIAIDSSDNLYIADMANHRIRKIDSATGNISTFAGDGTSGSPGAIGDGDSAITAQLNLPTGIAIDIDGNIFIADRNNHSIRKVDTAGDISTIIGIGTAGFSGDGNLATETSLNHPTDVSFTAYGNLLIADFGNLRIRQLTTDNLITTIAGSGNLGFSGDGGLATQASFLGATNISVDVNNTLHISDVGNNRIRTVELNTPPTASDNTVLIAEDTTCITLTDEDDNKIVRCNFLSSDFSFSDSDANQSLSSIKITALASTGTLKLNNTNVTLNQVIPATSIPMLTFLPALNAFGLNNDNFQFTVNDRFNNSQISNTITIDVTAVNDAPIISGTPTLSVNEGSAYSFTPSVIDIENDTIKYSLSYEPGWISLNPTTGELSGTPGNDDVGTYNLTLTASDDPAGASDSLPPFSITVHNINDLPSGNISISGVLKEGGLLTVNTSLLRDNDNPDKLVLGTLRYLWQRGTTNIGTNSSYRLVNADIGPSQAISVTVSYTDRRGTDESVTTLLGNPSDEITGNSPVLGDVTISGQPYIGQTLSAVTSDLTDADSDVLGPLSYEWRRSGTTGVVGTESSYLLTTSDENQTITLTVSYTDLAGYDESVTSASTVSITIDPLQDSDGDGLSDRYEIEHGLDPDISNLDVDNDGVTNQDELDAGTDPTKDDYPPADFTVPTDKTVNSTGLLTAVDLGTATAIDGKDGVVTAIPGNNGPFRPGTHIISWTATDAAGNPTIASTTQTVTVIPMVNFAIDQTSEELGLGDSVTVSVHLNGPVTTSFNIPFTLGGSANSDDHNISAIPAEQYITIAANDVSGGLSFNITNADATEVDEILIFTMGDLSTIDLIAGNKITHTVTITEKNIAPKLSIKMTQGASDEHTSTVIASAGDVTVTAKAIDTNANSVFLWNESDNALVDSGTDPRDATFTFSPAGLDVGTYTIVVTASDIGELVTTRKHRFNVVVSAVGDQNDIDGDGITNELDKLALSHVIALQQADQSKHLVETEPGLQLRLGAIAFESATNGLQVSASSIETYATSIRFPNDDYFNVGGLFDFEIHGLATAGDSALVVIPLRNKIPTDPYYRKLMPTGWQNFVLDDNNALASAPGSNGSCPPVNSSAYRLGLTPGHLCVQLLLEDGGPNDTDETANGVIIDPGGVAVEPVVSVQPPPKEQTPLPNTGGGTLYGTLLLLLLLVHLRFRKPLKQFSH